MIRLQETLELPGDADHAFAFLADFRNLPRWDPGIAHVEQLDGGSEPAIGARYKVIAAFLGRHVPMDYEVRRLDAEGRLAELVGEAPTLTAIDRIEVEPTRSGIRVRWTADFEMKGALGHAEFLMRPLLNRVARSAMNGMRRTLTERAHPRAAQGTDRATATTAA